MERFRRSGWAAFPVLALLAVVVSALVACSGKGGATPVAAKVRVHVSADDRAWLYEAHQADLAEISAGTLGQLKGGSPQIKTAAAAIVADHTAFDTKLVQVAVLLGLGPVLPHHMTLAETEVSDRLGLETGPEFDHDFTASMMTAHQQLIADTQAEIAHGSAPQVVSLARQALPVLRKHLHLLQVAAPTG